MGHPKWGHPKWVTWSVFEGSPSHHWVLCTCQFWLRIHLKPPLLTRDLAIPYSKFVLCPQSWIPTLLWFLCEPSNTDGGRLIIQSDKVCSLNGRKIGPQKSLQFSCCWTELRKSVKHGHHLYEWLSMSFHSFYLPSGWLVILYKGQGNMSQALHMLCYGIWSILILNGFNHSLNLQKTPHHLTRPDPDPDPTPTGE